VPPSQLNQWLYCSAAERPALSITTTGSADKGKEGPCGPSSTTPQVNVQLGYFFFDFDLLDDADAFFELALEDFFELANALTTFHAVRDLTVAPCWQSRRISPTNLVCNFVRGEISWRVIEKLEDEF